MNREDGLLTNRGIKEASTVLLSLYNHGNDGPTDPESNEQARCRRAHGPVGRRADPV